MIQIISSEPLTRFGAVRKVIRKSIKEFELWIVGYNLNRVGEANKVTDVICISVASGVWGVHDARIMHPEVLWRLIIHVAAA